MPRNIVLIQSAFAFISFCSGNVPIFPTGSQVSGIENLDPAFINFIEISVVPNIIFQLRNITVPDLPKCTSEKSLYNNEELTYEFRCDTVIRGLYFMQSSEKPDEKVDNKFYVFLKNATITFQYFVEESNKEDGNAYFQLKDRKHHSSIRFNMKEQQMSLVDLNEYIGAALTQFSTDHDITSIITQPIMNEVFKKVELSLRRYFEITPIKYIEI